MAISCQLEIIQPVSSLDSLPPLTVSHTRRVLLSKALVCLLNIQDGQRLDLVPPVRSTRGGRATLWHLDTQSRTGYPVRLRRDGKAWLTIAHHLGPEHLHRPAVGVSKGTALSNRRLRLGLEDSTRPGIYFLHPA